jgi:hypothetical protein
MLHVLSLALFAGVMAISIATIIATIQADLPLILKALGLAPPLPYAPLSPDGARRPERSVRIIRQARFAPKAQPVRAAA